MTVFFFYKNLVTDALTHSGVKGMKWGVRNGPPYPLNEEHDATNRYNLGKRYVKFVGESLDARTRFTIPQGRSYISALMNAHDFDWNEVTSYSKEESLSGFHNPLELIKNNPSAHKVIRDVDSISAHEHGRISDRDLELTNPGFGEPGTVQNCAKATFALEMRKRGYDISAGRQTFPTHVGWTTQWFKEASPKNVDPLDADDYIRSFGKSTSGSLSYGYKSGSGHSIHWTVDDSGNLEYQCGQSGRRYSGVKELIDKAALCTDYYATICRLDNLDIDYDNAIEDSAIRFSHPASKVKNRNTGQIVDTW